MRALARFAVYRIVGDVTKTAFRTRNFAILCVPLFGLFMLGIYLEQQRRDGEVAVALAQFQKSRGRFITETFLPWMNPMCGIGYDIAVCDARAWPGGRYPTERLAHERTPGVTWTCTSYQQREYGRVRTCTASASAERRARFPCHVVNGPCFGGREAFRRLATANGWPWELRN
jgi:hypothetical protein